MVLIEYTPYYKKKNAEEQRVLRNGEFILIHTIIPLLVFSHIFSLIAEDYISRIEFMISYPRVMREIDEIRKRKKRHRWPE